MTNKEEITAIKAVAPKYDKSLHSKCKRPSIYGIRRTSTAQAAFNALNGKRPDNRKLSHRITIRLSQGEFAQLQQKVSGLGVTVQDFGRAAIRAALKEIAPAAGTAETTTEIKTYGFSISRESENVNET